MKKFPGKSFQLRASPKEIDTVRVDKGQGYYWMVRKHSLLHEAMSYAILKLQVPDEIVTGFFRVSE